MKDRSFLVMDIGHLILVILWSLLKSLYRIHVFLELARNIDSVSYEPPVTWQTACCLRFLSPGRSRDADDT